MSNIFQFDIYDIIKIKGLIKMLVLYSYLTKDNKTHGPYQADDLDFKKLFKNEKFRSDLSSIYIWIKEKKEVWIYTKKTLSKYSGWQLARKY